MNYTITHTITTQTGRLLSIALFRLKSYEIEDELISLVNPNEDISEAEEHFIGMSSRKIRRTPQFHELAKRLIQLTENSVLVGFSIQNTLQILQKEFKSLGYDFSVPTIDLGEKIISLNPDLQHIDKHKWFHYWGIPYSQLFSPKLNGMALVQLFRIFQLQSKSWIALDKNVEKLPLADLLHQLPYKTGLVYGYDEQQKLAYMASCFDINSFVSQSITQNENWIQNISYIDYEITDNKLIADLKQFKESQENHLKWNPKTTFFGIYEEKNNGIPFLYAEAIAETRKKSLLVFDTEAEALQYIWYLSQKFELNFSYNQKDFMHLTLEILASEQTEIRKKMRLCRQFLQFENDQFLLLFKGRIEGETAFVAIQNQEVKGFGYFHLNYQIRSWESVTHLLTPLPTNKITFSWVFKALEHKQYESICII